MREGRRPGPPRLRGAEILVVLALAPAWSVPAAAEGHRMLHPPAHPQVAALASDPRDGALWVLARDGLWRLDPRTGESARAEHAPLTADLAALETTATRLLPPFALGIEAHRVIALLPGGRYRRYTRSRRPRWIGEGRSASRAVRYLGDALSATGTSHLDLWPGREARFQSGGIEVVVRAREIRVRTDAGESVQVLPGLTYADLMRLRPGDWGKVLDANAGVGPFLLAGRTLWMGLEFEMSGRLTGIGGLIRMELPDGRPTLLRPPELRDRPLRSLVAVEGGLLLAAGRFREGRWWEGREEPAETLWYGRDAGLLALRESTGTWSLRPALADPLGVEAPVALLARDSTLWVGMGSGFVAWGPEGGFDLYGLFDGEDRLRRMDAPFLAAAISGPGPGRCGATLWVRRVRLPPGALQTALLAGLRSGDPMQRALSAATCAWQGEEACLDALIRLLPAEEDACAAREEALALGRLGRGRPDAAGALEERVEGRARDAPVPLLSRSYAMRTPPASHSTHAVCSGCASLRGQGPGGDEAVVAALSELGEEGVPVLLGWLRSGDRRLVGLGRLGLQGRPDLPGAVLDELEATSGRTASGAPAALTVLRDEATRGGGMELARMERLLRAIREVEQARPPGTEEALTNLLDHPLLGPAALEALHHLRGPEWLGRTMEDSSDAAIVASAVSAAGRRRDPSDLPRLGRVLARAEGGRWDPGEAARVRRAVMEAARYYGTAEGWRLWWRAAGSLRDARERRAALYEARVLGLPVPQE